MQVKFMLVQLSSIFLKFPRNKLQPPFRKIWFVRSSVIGRGKMRTEQVTELTLYTLAGKPLSVQVIAIILEKQSNHLTKCCLHLRTTWKDYQWIEAKGLFNLDPDLRSGVSKKAFLSNYPLEMTVLLRPDLLIQLENYANDATTVANYFKYLGQETSSNSFLFTESWLGLSVEQHQKQGVIGYRTLWDYFNWDGIDDNYFNDLDDILKGAITSFLKDSAIRELSENSLDSIPTEQAILASTELLETLFEVVPSLLSEEQQAKHKLVNAVTNVFKQSLEADLSKSLETLTQDEAFTASVPTTNSLNITSLFEAIVSFFQHQNWVVSQHSENSVLHFSFQGEYGKWECYAQVREAEQQLVFYSVLPVKAAKKSRHLVAEFLTRANYGLILGNFEMDFNDGEIRYKTSIGVEGSHLDFALIQQVVYSNLSITDKYLPGILQVMNGQKLPATAIAQIEQQVS